MRERPSATLVPLATLRFRLVTWYVGTYAVILLVLGGGLFFVVTRQVRRELDNALRAAVTVLEREGPSSGDAQWLADESHLRIPGLSLYLFDSSGHALIGDSAGDVVHEAVRAATTSGVMRQRPSGAEKVSRAFARSFRAPDGAVLTAAAAADLEDLEDRYTTLIGQFSAAAAIALALVALGGVFLARKSSAPVEAVVEQMRRFMADASHELRTPVTVVRTEAEVALVREDLAPDDRRAFEVIASESARLGAVVEDLLILARAEGAELVVERSALFLDDIVSDAVSAFGTVAAQRGVSLTLGAFDEAPVSGSELLLRRLVYALIDNAIKYTPTGGSVTVSVRAEAEWVVLDVIDTGIGIAEQALPRVFDRFSRSERGRAAAAGTGLGLPIARWIAEAHGGALTLASVVEEGTTATVRLPRR